MKIVYQVGSLLDSPQPCILQQCNNRGAMGSGVAKAIRQRYPFVFAVYYTESISARGLVMGSVVWADCRSENGGHLVGNIIGQDGFGADGKLYTDYTALRAGLREVNQHLKNNGITEVGLPLIGAGLGGGDWSTIAAIIEDEMTDVKPIAYVLDPSQVPDVL